MAVAGMRVKKPLAWREMVIMVTLKQYIVYYAVYTICNLLCAVENY